MKTDELREKYLEFYKTKDHTVVASDVLVPKWDKSVLFTPAGMNQFCLLYTSPSPRDQRGSRMPSSA